MILPQQSIDGGFCQPRAWIFVFLSPDLFVMLYAPKERMWDYVIGCTTIPRT
jgi:hypothetical protein